MLLWQSYLFGWSGGKGKKHGDMFPMYTVLYVRTQDRRNYCGEVRVHCLHGVLLRHSPFLIILRRLLSLLLAAQKINALFIYLSVVVAFIHYVVLLQ